MKRLLVALALVVLCATTAVAHPRDKNSRYLFLAEAGGAVTFVDAQSLKAIPNSGGHVSYFGAMEFTDGSSELYVEIKKVYPAYKPVFVFNNIVLDCTNGRFKVLKMTVAGTADGESKPVVLFENERNFSEVAWEVLPNGISERAKQIICKPALGTVQ